MPNFDVTDGSHVSWTRDSVATLIKVLGITFINGNNLIPCLLQSYLWYLYKYADETDAQYLLRLSARCDWTTLKWGQGSKEENTQYLISSKLF